MEPEYKLNYFNMRGMGEAIRLIFHYAGVKFEDRKFTHEEWSSIKSGAPFGKAPWIEYKGEKLAESAAICRYLSRKYGLAGKDDWEQAQVDALFDLYKDFGTVVQPYFMVMFGRQQGDKETLYKNMSFAFDEVASRLEQYLNQAKNGFFMSSGVTWIDFFISEFHDTLNGFHPELFKNHIELLIHSKNVHDLPQLQKYLKNRPKTDN